MIFTYRFVHNKFLISFYKKLFLSILTSSPPPPWPIMPFLYDVLNVKPQLYVKGLVWSRGGGGESTSEKLFLFPICWIAKTVFSTHIFNRFWSNASFSWKNITFFETFFFAIFMGNPSLRLSEVLCFVKHEIWCLFFKHFQGELRVPYLSYITNYNIREWNSRIHT